MFIKNVVKGQKGYMDKFDRIQQLHRFFISHRFPIPIHKIAEELECTNKTAKNAINILLDHVHAPLIYDKETKGWHYDKNADTFELPGLWLTSNELTSLSTILHILDTMNENLLGEEIKVVQDHIKQLLLAKGIKFTDFTRSIKYISTTKRPIISRYFSTIADALINKKQLIIHYSDYSGNSTQRTISPQTLIHYQENWYLDAWCHKRHNLRSFMLARITKAIKESRTCQPVPEKKLNEHYQSSYGIFAGKAIHVAVLKFYPPVTKEVSTINWHPQQQSEWRDNTYILTFPYNDDRELIRDILKYGQYIEVIKPTSLKNKIKHIAHNIINMYSDHEKNILNTV